MNHPDKVFVKTVWQYYEVNGRHDLPWRQKSHLTPYHILVSELMLQQTQVDRVRPKYQAFLKRWGSARALSQAPLGEVLKEWQGLGYNRRAKHLLAATRVVTTKYGGRFPRRYEDLLKLPGVGPYTAGAVMAFAYNEPVPFIETNIRSVYLHHFFADATDVDDRDLGPLIERTLDRKRPREWYWALMDYGSYLKRTHGNNISRSKQYKKQPPFRGSDREIRGALLRELANEPATRKRLQQRLSQFDALRLDAQLERLLAEELTIKTGHRYHLPE